MESNIENLLRRLESSNALSRRNAEKQLQELGVDVIKPLIHLKQQAELEMQTGISTFNVVMVFAVSVLSLYLFGLCILVETSGEPNPFLFGTIILLAAAASTRLIWLRVLPSERRQLTARHERAARRIRTIEQFIDQFDEKDLVGFLIECTQSQLGTSSIAPLGDVLGMIGPDDGQLINRRQREILYQFLQPQYGTHEPEFVCAILTALQNVGDTPALPVVERLLQQLEDGAQLSTLREAAQDCLSRLQEIAELERSGRILLRPSTAPEMDSNTLVRPAGNPCVADSSTLVRPADMHVQG